MIPEEAIELAAKAAYEAGYPSSDYPWEALNESERSSYRRTAEAVLAVVVQMIFKP